MLNCQIQFVIFTNNLLIGKKSIKDLTLVINRWVQDKFPSVKLSGKPAFYPKWVRLAPNGTIPSILKARRAKMYWNQIWKCPRIVPSRANPTYLWPKFGFPVLNRLISMLFFKEYFYVYAFVIYFLLPVLYVITLCYVLL